MGDRVKTLNAEVAGVFSGYPAQIRTRLLALKKLILEIAAKIEVVGELQEHNPMKETI